MRTARGEPPVHVKRSVWQGRVERYGSFRATGARARITPVNDANACRGAQQSGQSGAYGRCVAKATNHFGRRMRSLHDATGSEELRKFERSESFRPVRGRPEPCARVTRRVAANGGNRRRAPRIAAVYRSGRIISLERHAIRRPAGAWRDAGRAAKKIGKAERNETTNGRLPAYRSTRQRQPLRSSRRRHIRRAPARRRHARRLHGGSPRC